MSKEDLSNSFEGKTWNVVFLHRRASDEFERINESKHLGKLTDALFKAALFPWNCSCEVLLNG